MLVTKIPINDSVPDTWRGHDYRAIRDRMERNLKDLTKVYRYATHESGHLIYFMKTKLVSSPEDAIYAGPTIYLKNEKIEHYNAAVNSPHTLLSDPALEITQDLLDKLALAAFAGGAIERAFLGEDEDTANAMDGDENRLHSFCYKGMTDFEIPFDGYGLWSSARRLVEDDVLKNRADIASKVENARRIVLGRCFGLDATLFTAHYLNTFSNNAPH
jgi:hypothetical protein